MRQGLLASTTYSKIAGEREGGRQVRILTYISSGGIRPKRSSEGGEVAKLELLHKYTSRWY